MKITKYIIGAGLLLASITETSAQGQESAKNYYRMSHIKADQPWITSQNASGLILNTITAFSIVEAGFNYKDGDYRNVMDPASVTQLTLLTESVRQLKKVFFYGRFSFDYANRKEMSWTSLVDPYHSPLLLADSTPGNQRLEVYHLQGGVGYALGKHFGIGAKIDYQIASNAKRKDARNENTYMNFNIHPSILYHTTHFRIGANFTYHKLTEDVKVSVIGNGKSHEVYEFEGLWYYTSEVLNDGGTLSRVYREDALGGGIQIEFAGQGFRFFNQLTYIQRNQENFINRAIKERNGEVKEDKYVYTGALNFCGEKYDHHIALSADISSMLGYENIQNQKSGELEYTSYGKKNKSVTDAVYANVSYHLFRNRNAPNTSWDLLAGVRGYNLERSFRLYPIQYMQDLHHIEGFFSFNKNFLFRKGMLDCRLNLAYGEGDGTLEEQEEEALSTEMDAGNVQQKTTLRDKEYDYLTGDRFTGGLNLRYTHFINKEKGQSLYANAVYACRKSLSGIYDGEKRNHFGITIGFAF